MTNWKFNDDMVEVLKSFIGQRFVSYEKDNQRDNQSYCVVRINFDDKSVIIKNKEEAIAMLSDETISEYAARFSCHVVDVNCPFCAAIDNVGTVKHIINENVSGVKIITDKILSPKGDMDIELDMAVEIVTDKHCYTFSKSATWFDETIYINIDTKFDDICPIAKEIEMWSDDEKLSVAVERSVCVL